MVSLEVMIVRHISWIVALSVALSLISGNDFAWSAEMIFRVDLVLYFCMFSFILLAMIGVSVDSISKQLTLEESNQRIQHARSLIIKGGLKIELFIACNLFFRNKDKFLKKQIEKEEAREAKLEKLKENPEKYQRTMAIHSALFGATYIFSIFYLFVI